MNRTEIIYALAKYAHPSWYHDILSLPTSCLELLLKYYEEPGENKGRIEIIFTYQIAI